MTPDDDRTHAAQLEAEGDALLLLGRVHDAFDKFREAESLDHERVALYDKLIATHRQLTAEWTHDDFAQSLTWEMQKQALEHPEVLATMERLTPEWNEVTERLRRVLVTTDEAVIAQLVTEIAAFKEKAVRPLLDFILLLKSATTAPDLGEDPTTAESTPDDVP